MESSSSRRDNFNSRTLFSNTAPRLIVSINMALSPTPRAFCFDVFGTCVDWRKSMTSHLVKWAHKALNDPTASLASQLRVRASAMTEDDWARFAQEWRDCYKSFTKQLAEYVSGDYNYMTIDDYHHKSLKELLVKWELQGLWNAFDTACVSNEWHHLDPWEDSVQGVQMLNQLCATCTLSNGNLSLLGDLSLHSGIPFTHILSSELFGTYKPNSRVYRGAAEQLGLSPNQCVMVAAHLRDLKGAKENGMQTVYVERPDEEDWSKEEIEKARTAGWVDMWIELGEGNRGFITLAERLGLKMPGGNSDDARLSTSLPTGVH